MKHFRFQAKVNEGRQSEISVTLKIPQNIMDEIIKGTDERYIGFKLF